MTGRLSDLARALRRLDVGGPAGNVRLTALTGVVLLVLLTLQVLSALAFLLLSLNVDLPAGPVYDVVRPVHFFAGFLLIPVVAVKLTSVGYRFALYYLRDREYRLAGPPPWLARATAPVLAGSAAVVGVSGVEMWSFRDDLIGWWTQLHVLGAIVFAAALLLHLALRLPLARREAGADLSAPPGDPARIPGGPSRRVFLGAGVLVGLGLAASAANWPLPRLSWLYARPAGTAPLDFPVMNYEGGAQVVDAASWRLRVTGMVGRPLELGLDALFALPTEEHRYALNCVTGWTATRTWRGVPLARLLELAQAGAGFGHVQVRSTSGYHWDYHRDHMLQPGAMLVTHVDGVRLDDAHGFPARLMIPGLEGQSNVKWVDGLVVGRGPAQLYVSPNLVPRSQDVTGPLLTADPAGHRP